MSPVGFGLLRISTNPRILRSPLTVKRALALVEGWIARPPVMLLQPSPRHQEFAFGILRQLGTGGDLVGDAQLAAFVLENHAKLHSAEFGFRPVPWPALGEPAQAAIGERTPGREQGLSPPRAALL